MRLLCLLYLYGFMQGGGTRRGLLLHVPPLGLTDRWMMAWSGFESLKRRHYWAVSLFFPPLRRFFADHTLVEQLELAGSSSVWNSVYSGGSCGNLGNTGGKDLL